MRRAIIAAAFFTALVVAWQLVAMFGGISPVLLPPPADVAHYLVDASQDGTLLDATLVTARRLGIGYAIGLALGLPLGCLTARFTAFSDTIGVLALGLQTLPSVCWVPLALLWFGQTESAMLFVVVMGTLWSVLLASDAGIRSIPPIYVRAARTMGSSGMHTVLRVMAPASLPVVVTGMKQGWAFAWRSLMAAEIYVTILTGFGLGALLHHGRELMAMEKVLAIMLVIVVVGFAADRLLFLPAEKWIRRRWNTSG